MGSWEHEFPHPLSGILSVEEESKYSNTERNEVNHEAVYFTGILKTHSSTVGEQKIRKTCALKESTEISAKKKRKPSVIDPDAFDIEPLEKPDNDNVKDKFGAKFVEYCTPREYRDRFKRIKLSPIRSTPSSEFTFKLDPRKIRRIYKECLGELKAKIPIYYGANESALNSYHELTKYAFHKKRVSSNYNNRYNVKHARGFSNEIAVPVTDETRTMSEDDIFLEHKDKIVLKRSVIELDSSSKSIQRATTSNASTAGVDGSCRSEGTNYSSTQSDDLPELLAEAVGPRLHEAFQAKKLHVRLKKRMANDNKGEECSIKSSEVSKMQTAENNDEGNGVCSSMESTLEASSTPNKKSVNIPVSSTNKSLQVQEEEIASSHYQKTIDAKVPTLSRARTRVCSAKSPRISRVVSSGTHKETTEPMRAVSDSSPVDQNLRTEISEKLTRVRAKFKVNNSRKVCRTFAASYRDKWKRRKCENALNLSFLSDTDQESDMTASTVDDDELKNDISDMNELSITRDESEEGSTLRDPLCISNAEDGDERRISSIISSNTKKVSDSVSTSSRYMERETREIPNTKSQTDEHHEREVVRRKQMEDERQQSSRNSIDSGICIQEASPLQSPLPIATDELSRLDDNFADPGSKRRSCMNLSQPNDKMQSLNLDDLLRGQTKFKGMLDEFMCQRPNLLEKKNDVCVESSNIRSDPESVTSLDSSIVDEANMNPLTNLSAINIRSKFINPQNQEVLSVNRPNMIEGDDRNRVEEVIKSSSLNEGICEEFIDKRSVKNIGANANNEHTEYPLETKQTSKEGLSHNNPLNGKRCEGSSDSVNLQSQGLHSAQTKDTHQQKERIVSNQNFLPPKKRSFINTDCSDNICGKRVETAVSTQVFNTKELGSRWDCVTSIVAKEETMDTNNSGKPIDGSIIQKQLTQESSTPLTNNQSQSSVQLHSPMELQCQVQPQGLVVKVAATMQQSHTIVIDNNIPPRPIGILSYVQTIDNPIVPVMPKDTNSTAIPCPSLSIPLTIASSSAVPVTTTLSTSIHVSTAPSTSAGEKPPISKLCHHHMPTSSMGLSVQSSPILSELPLDIMNSIDHQSMIRTVSAKDVNNSSRINTINRQVIEHTENIIRNIVSLRVCQNSLCHPLSPSDQQRLSTDCLSLAVHVVYAMNKIQQLRRFSSVCDVITFIVAHSTRTTSGVPPITFAEIDAVQNIYQMANNRYSQPPTMQTQNLQSKHRSQPVRNPICPPSYANYNHLIVQNPLRMMPIQPVPIPPPQPPSLPLPPSPRPQPARQRPRKFVSSSSTKNNAYPGMSGSKPRTSSNSIQIPKASPSSTVSMQQESRVCSQSEPSLSAPQIELLKIQMSTYRNICRSLKFDLDKYRNMLLYNESLRQIQQQELIALRQQQQPKESQPLQQHSVNSTARHNLMPQLEQQQSLIDEQTHERHDNENNNLHVHPQSELTQSTSPNRNVTECKRIAVGDDLAKPERFQATSFRSPEATSTIINTTAATSTTETISSIGSVLSTSVKLEDKSNIGDHIERDREGSPMKENEIDTKNIKEELIALPEFEVEEETAETNNNPSTTDSFGNDKNGIFCNVKKDQGNIAELITLDDSSSDDDSNCISGTSNQGGKFSPPTDTKSDEINYNQSSIDEELECEALSKKMGIQASSYFQDAPIDENGVPVITNVTTIDNHTFEHFNEGLNHNLFMNDDIIDITDMAVKLECNASPHSDCSDTADTGFVGEMMQGSVPRPNCFNCKLKRGEIVCECGEVIYCSGQCVKVHWRKFHSNVCKGPPIDIDSIDEITLDDD